jgi:hypothetical protein
MSAVHAANVTRILRYFNMPFAYSSFASRSFSISRRAVEEGPFQAVVAVDRLLELAQIRDDHALEAHPVRPTLLILLVPLVIQLVCFPFHLGRVHLASPLHFVGAVLPWGEKVGKPPHWLSLRLSVFN